MTKGENLIDKSEYSGPKHRKQEIIQKGKLGDLCCSMTLRGNPSL